MLFCVCHFERINLCNSRESFLFQSEIFNERPQSEASSKSRKCSRFNCFHVAWWVRHFSVSRIVQRAWYQLHPTHSWLLYWSKSSKPQIFFMVVSISFVLSLHSEQKASRCVSSLTHCLTSSDYVVQDETLICSLMFMQRVLGMSMMGFYHSAFINRWERGDFCHLCCGPSSNTKRW